MQAIYMLLVRVDKSLTSLFTGRASPPGNNWQS